MNREEINKKVSKTLKGKSPPCNTPEAHIKGGLTRKRLWLEKVLKKDWDKLNKYERKVRVFEEQGRACEKCRITNWQGEPITFEYHHKDGDKSNDSRINVSVLCPNCHSQTNNYRYKNASEETKLKLAKLSSIRWDRIRITNNQRLQVQILSGVPLKI